MDYFLRYFQFRRFFIKCIFPLLQKEIIKQQMKLLGGAFFVLIISMAYGFRMSALDYDINQSKQFQSYCVLTHCNKELLLNWNCKLCPNLTTLHQRTYIENNLTNTVAFIGYHERLNAILLIFRGTEDIRNWLEDFSYYQSPYPRCKDCKVHSGFYTAYLSISLQLIHTIQSLLQKHPTAQLITLGSSLGASIATITAIEFQAIFGNVRQLQTFGGPRVGDENFVKYLTMKVNEIRRVVHNRDVVPHVPLVSQRFVHPPYQIWFDEQMESYKQCNQSGEDPTCSNSVYPNFSIEDHIGYWQKPIVSQICQ